MTAVKTRNPGEGHIITPEEALTRFREALEWFYECQCKNHNDWTFDMWWDYTKQSKFETFGAEFRVWHSDVLGCSWWDTHLRVLEDWDNCYGCVV